MISKKIGNGSTIRTSPQYSKFALNYCSFSWQFERQTIFETNFKEYKRKLRYRIIRIDTYYSNKFSSEKELILFFLYYLVSPEVGDLIFQLLQKKGGIINETKLIMLGEQFLEFLYRRSQRIDPLTGTSIHCNHFWKEVVNSTRKLITNYFSTKIEVNSFSDKEEDLEFLPIETSIFRIIDDYINPSSNFNSNELKSCEKKENNLMSNKVEIIFEDENMPEENVKQEITTSTPVTEVVFEDYSIPKENVEKKIISIPDIEITFEDTPTPRKQETLNIVTSIPIIEITFEDTPTPRKQNLEQEIQHSYLDYKLQLLDDLGFKKWCVYDTEENRDSYNIYILSHKIVDDYLEIIRNHNFSKLIAQYEEKDDEDEMSTFVSTLAGWSSDPKRIYSFLTELILNYLGFPTHLEVIKVNNPNFLSEKYKEIKQKLDSNEEIKSIASEKDYYTEDEEVIPSLEDLEKVKSERQNKVLEKMRDIYNKYIVNIICYTGFLTWSSIEKKSESEFITERRECVNIIEGFYNNLKFKNKIPLPEFELLKSRFNFYDYQSLLLRKFYDSILETIIGNLGFPSLYDLESNRNINIDSYINNIKVTYTTDKQSYLAKMKANFKRDLMSSILTDDLVYLFGS